MKLALASCAKLQSTNPQPVWAEIQTERPDARLLLGDTVYLNHDRHDDPAALGAELRALYAAQLAKPNFAHLLNDLRARGAQVLAIYDDHDFLGNNRYGGDHSAALRESACVEFIRAFAPPQTGQNVYHLRRVASGLPTSWCSTSAFTARRHRFRHPTATPCWAARNGTGWSRWLPRRMQATSWSLRARRRTLSEHPQSRAAPSPPPVGDQGKWQSHTSLSDERWEQYPTAFKRITDLLRGRKCSLVLSGDVQRNAVYDDSGVIEIVSSGVARNGIVFGSPRRNYGLLTFDEEQVHVELRSLKVGGRFDFLILRNHWVLP